MAWKWRRRGKVEQRRRRMRRGNGKRGGRGERKVARHPAAYPWTLWGGLSFHLFPLSFSPSCTHTRAHTRTHSARLAHEGAVAIKLAQHGAQIERETERGREDSTLHEHYPWKTEMRRERRRKWGREGWIDTERTEVKWCDDGGNDGENSEKIGVLLVVVIALTKKQFEL